MSENEIVVNSNAVLMPVMDLATAQQSYQAMVDFTKSIMKRDIDFGIVPGTDKPTLLKPGAEKLCRFFGLAVRFTITKEIEEWFTEEPFFYYRYSCAAYRLDNGALVAEGEGSCNSHEKKYRYRGGAHVCPDCGQAAIIPSKQKPGWYCFPKKGGCGSSFPPAQFTGQPERILNPDLADQVNTLQKMAQKRALIAAVLIACNASEYYTQDVEDLDFGYVAPAGVVDGQIVGGDTPPKAPQTAPSAPSAPLAPHNGQTPASGAEGAQDATDWPLRPWGLATIKAWTGTMYDAMTDASKTKAMTTEEHKKLGQAVSTLFPDKATRKIFQYMVFGADNYSIDGMSVATGKTYRAWARDMTNAKLEVDSIVATQEFEETSTALATGQTELG